MREMGDIFLSVFRVSAHHCASGALSPWDPCSRAPKMPSTVGCRKVSLISGILQVTPAGNTSTGEEGLCLVRYFCPLGAPYSRVPKIFHGGV